MARTTKHQALPNVMMQGEALRGVPVKKEQSNFEVQARFRPIISGACRKVPRGQSKFPTILAHPVAA
eukprot:476491-Pelagomonas_calceolata.AAC.1